MAEYRDPKVTTTDKKAKSGGMSSWIWIAAGVIVLLLLLAWLFGWFGADEEEVEVVDPVVVEEPLVSEEPEVLEDDGDVEIEVVE